MRTGNYKRSPARRSRAERDRLVLQFIYLPRHVYKRLANIPAIRRLGPEEAESIGFVVLLRAAEIFNERRGIRFMTYAFCSIRSVLMRQARMGGVIHIPQHLADETRTWKAASEDVKRSVRTTRRIGHLPPNNLVPERQQDDHEHEELHAAIARLTPKDRAILLEYYDEGVTLEELGRRRGVTKERGRQIRDEALGRLREIMVLS